MLYKLLHPLFFLILLFSCLSSQKQSKIFIKFKGEQVFEKNKSFEGLRVGGLSGLIFDVSSGYFFALSDDKKNHRFYKLALTAQPRYKLEIKKQIFLKSPGHKRLKRNMDPEALAFYGNNIIFIASEGQQIYKTHEPTQIFTFDRQAVLKEAWPVPPVFWKAGHNKQPPHFGQKENKGFESLTLDNNSDTLWTATEKALKQDLILKQKSFIRLSAFDIKNKKLLAQYVYALNNSKEGGLTALQLLKPKVFISLERTYKKQKNNGINEAHLFFTDCRKADNVQALIQLKKGFKSCSKSLIWDSSKNPSVKVDNLEGLALGPVLPSQKKQLMVLVSDNNFNEGKQKTQFLFFELNTKKSSSKVPIP